MFNNYDCDSPSTNPLSTAVAGRQSGLVVIAKIEDPLATIAEALTRIADAQTRIADHLVPPPSDYLDSTELARRLGCTPTWIAKMARNGTIPKNCIVAGSGNGNLWKFHRGYIENWIENRR